MKFHQSDIKASSRREIHGIIFVFPFFGGSGGAISANIPHPNNMKI
jgi:hypothetical protein